MSPTSLAAFSALWRGSRLLTSTGLSGSTVPAHAFAAGAAATRENGVGTREAQPDGRGNSMATNAAMAMVIAEESIDSQQIPGT